MSSLLVWREKFQKFYANYSIYILKTLQLVMGLLLFWMINSNIGFMKTASSVFCTVGLAVICTFLPPIVMTFAASALVIVHFYALSMPIAIVSVLIFLLMYIFYFRFTPGKSWLVLASVLAFGLKVPFVIPVVFGLLGTPVWIVPAGCGIIGYYMIHFVKVSASALKASGTEGLTQGLLSFSKQVLASKEMWLMVMITAAAILVVNAVRTRSVDHAWKIASVAGAAVCIVAAAAGNLFLDEQVSYMVIVLSSVLGAAIGLVLEFFFFSVDYSRTEHVQFEDDEYYYYVKAVPKLGVSAPEKRVKRITDRPSDAEKNVSVRRQAMAQGNMQQPAGGEFPGGPAAQNNTEEILLTRSLSRELGLDQQRNNSGQQ